MEIDKETPPRFLWVSIEGKPAYLKALKEQSKEEDDERGLLLTLDSHSCEVEEYYYDERDNEINVSLYLTGAAGSSNINIALPISDKVYIDIVGGMVRRLNRLKTAMEALK